MLSSRNREKEEEREEMDKTSDPKCSHFLSLGLGSLTPAQARALYVVGFLEGRVQDFL